MPPTDIAELWRLHEAATSGKWVAMTAEYEAEDGIAWAEENKVEAVRRRHGYSVHVGLVAHNGDTLLDTLQRAREASDGRA